MEDLLGAYPHGFRVASPGFRCTLPILRESPDYTKTSVDSRRSDFITLPLNSVDPRRTQDSGHHLLPQESPVATFFPVVLLLFQRATLPPGTPTWPRSPGQIGDSPVRPWQGEVLAISFFRPTPRSFSTSRTPGSHFTDIAVTFFDSSSSRPSSPGPLRDPQVRGPFRLRGALLSLGRPPSSRSPPSSYTGQLSDLPGLLRRLLTSSSSFSPAGFPGSGFPSVFPASSRVIVIKLSPS